MVSWTLVGTPLRMVLYEVSHKKPLGSPNCGVSAYFLISSIFCQLGIVRLSQSSPREMTGSPKKPNPMVSVTPFVNMYDVTKKESPKSGITRVTIRRR